MELVLSEEQVMLQQAARDFVASRYPRSPGRRVTRTADGHSRELWKQMAALGWLGLTVDEEYGGAGLGYRYLMVVLEELGKGLVPEPVLSTVLLSATAIALGGSKALQSEHLPAIVAGERIFALAFQEAGSRFALDAVETSAEASGKSFVLRGEKTQVIDGSIADGFVISARAKDGIALFVVPAQSKGVTVVRQTRLDGRSAAIVRLSGVTVSDDARLGAPGESEGEGLELLARVIDIGTVGLTAEMLGLMTAAFGMTLEYLKTRVQFGVPIGSFQALQHRAARLYVETELARSAVMFAHAVADGDAVTDLARAASVAKAKCSDAVMLVAHESVQMHGGIGMTEEHPIGLYLKRARVTEMTFGDAAHHRRRFARHSGF
jgi:alkylation response protein AidB-like acyl-CoA dehydrogenase